MYSIELMTKPTRTRKLQRDDRGRFKAPADAVRDSNAQPPHWQAQQSGARHDVSNAQQR